MTIINRQPTLRELFLSATHRIEKSDMEQKIYTRLNTLISKAVVDNNLKLINVYERNKILYTHIIKAYGVLPESKYVLLSYYHTLCDDGFIDSYQALNLFGDNYSYFVKNDSETQEEFIQRKLRCDNVHILAILSAGCLNRINRSINDGSYKQKMKALGDEAALYQDRISELLYGWREQCRM